MPERYRKAGYVRKELPSLREIEKFESDHGVRSEIAHYDRGSGRGFDDGPIPGELPKHVRQLIEEGKISVGVRDRR